MANKWVYTFKEGNMTMRNLLGGKGANLAEMTEIGLPVPQGFTITTEACTQYYEDGRKINDEIMAQAMEGVAWMEKENGKKFGDLKNPLLVSVRSGARASMPGMMDTILNLGLNDDVVAAMIAGNKIHRRACRGKESGLPQGHFPAPGAHTKAGKGDFNDRKLPKQGKIYPNVPPLMQECRQQPQPQKPACIEIEQNVQRPAEQQWVPEHKRPIPEPVPHHGRFSAAEGSYRMPPVRNSKCRCAPVARPVRPAVPSRWPAATTSPART